MTTSGSGTPLRDSRSRKEIAAAAQINASMLSGYERAMAFEEADAMQEQEQEQEQDFEDSFGAPEERAELRADGRAGPIAAPPRPAPRR